MFRKTIVQNYKKTYRKSKPYASRHFKYVIAKGKKTHNKKEAKNNANRALKKAFRNKLKKDLNDQLLEL